MSLGTFYQWEKVFFALLKCLTFNLIMSNINTIITSLLYFHLPTISFFPSFTDIFLIYVPSHSDIRFIRKRSGPLFPSSPHQVPLPTNNLLTLLDNCFVIYHHIIKQHACIATSWFFSFWYYHIMQIEDLTFF